MAFRLTYVEIIRIGGLNYRICTWELAGRNDRKKFRRVVNLEYPLYCNMLKMHMYTDAFTYIYANRRANSPIVLQENCI